MHEFALFRSALPALHTHQIPIHRGWHTFLPIGVYRRTEYARLERAACPRSLHFGSGPRTPAFPHLSLCYIADEDAESGERDMFFQELKRGRYRARADGFGINCAESEEGDDWLFGFEASEIWAMKCEGPAEDWVFLEAVPLHSSLDDV
ncbi:hypothetical protein BD779DRAFT_1670841 [Infundibulicybe gibba]|nr:hypothetical protein BD779DRAFT_1670841 [Infundibulicybe gibba]